MMRGENNFDFLRILAAFGVLASHSYNLLLGAPDPLAARTGVSIGSLCVAIFFITSGYLIAKSWESDPHLLRYSLRRALRICPALYANIIVCMLVGGFFLTTLSLSEFWSDPATWELLKGFGVIPVRGYLPGVFPEGPYPFVLNAPLWTIRIEAVCYIIVALLGVAAVMKSKMAVAILAAATTVASAYVSEHPEYYEPFVFWFMSLSSFLLLFAFFSAGMALYLFRDSITWSPFAAILILPALYAAANNSLFSYIYPIGLSYAVLSLALRPVRGLAQVGRYGDYSYGLYLYAWPVQQYVLAHSWEGTSLPAYIAICTVISGAFAFASWHLIEKKALELKPRRPKPQATQAWSTSPDTIGQIRVSRPSSPALDPPAPVRHV